MPSPGMTTADTTNAEPGTFQESVLGDRFIGVVRTGGRVPTPWRTRRRPGLVDRDDAACEPTHRGSFPCVFRVLEASSLSNTSVTCSRRSWWVKSRADGKTMNNIAPVGSGRPVARRSSSRPRMRRRIRLRTTALPTFLGIAYATRRLASSAMSSRWRSRRCDDRTLVPSARRRANVARSEMPRIKQRSCDGPCGGGS